MFQINGEGVTIGRADQTIEQLEAHLIHVFDHVEEIRHLGIGETALNHLQQLCQGDKSSFIKAQGIVLRPMAEQKT